MKIYIKSSSNFNKPSKVVFYDWLGRTLIPDVMFNSLEEADDFADDHYLTVFRRYNDDGVRVPRYV